MKFVWIDWGIRSKVFCGCRDDCNWMRPGGMLGDRCLTMFTGDIKFGGKPAMLEPGIVGVLVFGANGFPVIIPANKENNKDPK